MTDRYTNWGCEYWGFGSGSFKIQVGDGDGHNVRVKRIYGSVSVAPITGSGLDFGAGYDNRNNVRQALVVFTKDNLAGHHDNSAKIATPANANHSVSDNWLSLNAKQKGLDDSKALFFDVTFPDDPRFVAEDGKITLVVMNETDSQGRGSITSPAVEAPDTEVQVTVVYEQVS